MIKVGEKLQEKRIEKGLSLEDVAKATKIKTPFLEFIEKGEYENLPSISYAQGFVRNYVKYLGLSEKEMMPIFRREYDSEKAYKVLPKGFEKIDEFSLSRFKIKPTAILIIFIIIMFLGYLVFQYRYAFINPPLQVNTPKNNSTISSSQVKVSGHTDSNATVYINKDLIFVNSSGNFEKIISVFPGKTIINVKSVSRFSRQNEKNIQINVQ